MGGGFGESSGSSGNFNGSSNTSSYNNASSTGLSARDILSAYRNFLPGTMQALSSSNLAQLQGTGAQAANAANVLQRQLSPEMYSAIGGGAQGANQGIQSAGDLLKSINLTGLSPGEYNATERGLNQYNTGTGNAGLVNPSNAISNAINFGGAFNNKLGIMSNALGANSGAVGAASNVAGAASPNTTGFNPLQIALGNTGFGANYISPITSVSHGSGAGGSSGQAWGQGSSSQQGINGNASACCFIFMEAYKGEMPLCIRKIRDKYYKKYPKIANGYKKMAKWLVPLMQQFKIVRFIVWYSMINPATKYASNLHKGLNKRISHFWLRTWATIG